MSLAGPAWEMWPLKKQPARGVFAAVVIVGSVIGAWSWTESAALTGMAAAVLIVTTSRFFFPTRYRLSAEGVEIGRPWRTQRRPWADFRGIRRAPGQLVLSPFERPTWLDAFRGETLLLPGDRGEVLKYVEAMVGPEARTGHR